jgi:tetratricopeptide (TPR) repeat protein
MEDTFNNFKDLGDNYYKNKDYLTAIFNYSKALEGFQENEMTNLVYLNRCLSYYKLELFTEALEDAIKATQIKPNYAKAWGRVGSCLLALNRKEDSIIAFDRASQLDSSNEYYKKLSNQKVEEIVIEEKDIEKKEEDAMLEKLKKLKSLSSLPIDKLFDNFPIDKLMGPLYKKMMNNKKLLDLHQDSNFMNKLFNNPSEVMSDPKMLDLANEVLKDLNKN